MLEHADGDDPVIASLLLPVITQGKAHMGGQARGDCTLIRDGELLLRQRETGDVHPSRLRHLQCEPAPARADVQHAHAGLEQELRHDVALLFLLRFLERLGAGVEIGT